MLQTIIDEKIETKRVPRKKVDTKLVEPVAREMPAGYVTGDEFEKRLKERITKFYKEHGLI